MVLKILTFFMPPFSFLQRLCIHLYSHLCKETNPGLHQPFLSFRLNPQASTQISLKVLLPACSNQACRGGYPWAHRLGLDRNQLSPHGCPDSLPEYCICTDMQASRTERFFQGLEYPLLHLSQALALPAQMKPLQALPIPSSRLQALLLAQERFSESSMYNRHGQKLPLLHQGRNPQNFPDLSPSYISGEGLPVFFLSYFPPII